MQITIDHNSFFVFDLDDTLFYEIDYLKSAYRHIAGLLEPFIQQDIYDDMLARFYRKENVFNWIIQQYQAQVSTLNISWLLQLYREHEPVLKLSKETTAFLQQVKALKIPAGLITDGRSITQRNKLKALQLTDYFADIIISEEFGSEKPDERNYLYFEHTYPGKNFYFFGDNVSKDFIVPSKLGWTTVCLKDTGHHIHAQDFSKYPEPDYMISSFSDITLCL